MRGAYRVIVTREGDRWSAVAPDVQGAHTWAEEPASLDLYIREASAAIEDLPPGAEDNMTIDYEYER